MTAFNFSAIDCRSCGNLVWDGLSSSGIPVKLDTARLNLTDEILRLLAGGKTYQAHRTYVSFEVTPRLSARMQAPNPVVLALHECYPLTTFGNLAPDYWDQAPSPLQTEEVLF